MQKIAVQKDLTPVQDYLTDYGYIVDTLDTHTFSSAQNSEYDAIVVTGKENAPEGTQITNTGIPIIDVTGMTPEEIHEQIQQAFL